MRHLALLCAVSMLFFGIACGSDNPPAPSKPDAPDAGTPDDTTPPDDAPKGGGGEATDGMVEDNTQPTAPPNAAVMKRTLKFSAIPSEKDVTGYKARFAKVAAYLSKKLDIPVEYQHANSYAQSVAAFRNGYIHLAWFGGLTGVQARHYVEGARAIAQGVEDPQYFSYFVAHPSTGLEKSDKFPMGIKGKKFTFGSESSTSGRLMPEFFVRKYGGMKPSAFFGQVAFSGAHNLTAKQVESGQFEVGALSYTTYDRMVAAGDLDPEKCKLIWKSDPYPDYNFTAHPDLDPIYGEGFTDKLQAAILSMTGKELLQDPFGRSGMIKATNEDFEPIRKLALELGFIE